ncbi:hypothetical protein [Mycolicibacterium hippocampi]|uniref:Helix-turn-helix domain-containing protein n=1 Tax=Mycolicibacterium hippocampi TaxID=659824 RepID=A0A7I9ZW56_9MYCO|nr:hypothetical protein [Mycolicibacterium hippocampi]GFH05033.1 hypothetical protein MHIP_55160 [Mycolicibacterium hippocampi]
MSAPETAEPDDVAGCHRQLKFAREARQAGDAAARARRVARDASRDAHRAGIPVEQIAAMLRVGTGTVRQWLA